VNSEKFPNDNFMALFDVGLRAKESSKTLKNQAYKKGLNGKLDCLKSPSIMN